MLNKIPDSRLCLLIDADVLAYRASASVEKVVSFDGDNYFPLASLTEAVHSFFSQLSTILEALETDLYFLCLSDGHNGGFRRKLYQPYKANRDGRPRPVVLHALREKLMNDEEHVYIRQGLEADDCLGILATYPPFMPGYKKVIVSIDKDMKGIPGFFYNLGKPNLGIQEIAEGDAALWHMTQTLVGDATDGYPGCPGVGPVKAAHILSEAPENRYGYLWPLVVEAFEERGLTKKEALTQARLARILQAPDWDFHRKEVKLWKP